MKKTRNFDICQIRPVAFVLFPTNYICGYRGCGSLQISHFLFYRSPTCCAMDRSLEMNLHFFNHIYVSVSDVDDLCRMNELVKETKFRPRYYAYHVDHENHDGDSYSDHASVTCFSFQLMARDTVIKR